MSSFDYSVSKRKGSVKNLSVLIRLIQCPSEGALSKTYRRRLISVLTVVALNKSSRSYLNSSALGETGGREKVDDQTRLGAITKSSRSSSNSIVFRLGGCGGREMGSRKSQKRPIY